MKYYQKIQEAADFLKKELKIDYINMAIVLGSGLGFFADYLDNKKDIPFGAIPNFGVSKVVGHGNRLVFGKLEGKNILIMEGRIHFYEGFSMTEVTFPIRVMKELGVEKLLLSNSAGGISGYSENLMLIEDHLDVFCQNPLIGENIEKQGTRFPDMSEVYSKELIEAALKVGKNMGISLAKGVYSYLTGPSYETPFDIKTLKLLGVDAVGMSTVPEAIVANHCGMKILGISCITNLSAGISKNPLSHQEVVETTKKVSQDFAKLIKGIIKEI